jgi:hypothetical protein
VGNTQRGALLQLKKRTRARITEEGNWLGGG